MATRAIYIVAVSDLTADGFLVTFKMFVARCGQCRHIWSDNGSNFVGAAKALRALFAQESFMFQDIAFLQTLKEGNVLSLLMLQIMVDYGKPG